MTLSDNIAQNIEKCMQPCDVIPCKLLSVRQILVIPMYALPDGDCISLANRRARMPLRIAYFVKLFAPRCAI